MAGYIDALYDNASQALGINVLQLKLVSTFFFSYPLCAILKRLPDDNYTLKHIYIVSISILYFFQVLKAGRAFSSLFVSSLVVYIECKYIKSSRMPWIAFASLMAHLLSNHVYYQYGYARPGEFDITGAQMVMVMKLSSFAWNVHDGRQPEAQLSDLQKDRRLKKLPGLLEYFSYVYFFPSVLAGPSFDFSEYHKYINFSMFDVLNKPSSDDGKSATKKPIRKRKIPKSGREAFRKVLQACFWLGIYLWLSPRITVEYLYSKGYRNGSFIWRAFYLWPLGFVFRLQYYVAWLLTDGACILAGLGFNGFDKDHPGKLRWDRVKNIDPIGFETGQSVHQLISSWNMNTNNWLRNYVYLRVSRSGKKPGFKSTLVTFATSAMWHGLLPGYYLTFITGALLQTVGKILRRNVRPFFMEPDLQNPGQYKWIYDFISYCGAQLAIAYAVQPFVLLRLEQSLSVWRGVYFYIHVVVFIILGIFASPLKYLIRAKVQKRTEKASEALKKRSEQELSNASMPMGIPNEDLEEIEAQLIDARVELETLKREIDDLSKRKQEIKTEITKKE